jgi:hypothetical protein
MAIPFAQHCRRLQEHIEKDYGIRVVTRDIPDPLTGDLNGAEIHVDFNLTSEQRLFLLGHLFGHGAVEYRSGHVCDWTEFSSAGG